MYESIALFVDNYAKEVAQLGFSIRREDLDNIQKIENIMREILHIDDELDKLGNENYIVCAANRVALIKILTNLRAAYEVMDTITLADILEYELLNEIESLLNELNAK